ncbi:leucine-rich repeat-containing protein 57-like isoform X1 [Convolutriloba macropyga]|uniref:leucine-rich repeat-containing protein 57-like isoform X1 n=1 Tax=Convolutriloba macropyga TaxID=536237 RepID=UPI003F51BE1F
MKSRRSRSTTAQSKSQGSSQGRAKQKESASQVRARVDTAGKIGALSLANFELKRVPESLKSIQNKLRCLDLSVNPLGRSDSFPGWFGHFQSLKSLQLYNCHLTHIPPENLARSPLEINQSVYNSPKLETLNVSNNIIQFISRDIGQLTNLKILNISCNRVQILPSTLSKCSRLEVLEASDNYLVKLPSGFGRINIVEINLNRNRLADLSCELSSCSRLKILRLEENCLTLSKNLKNVLANSTVSLICLDGNLITQKELNSTEEYGKYLERFTATKKKFT